MSARLVGPPIRPTRGAVEPTAGERAELVVEVRVRRAPMSVLEVLARLSLERDRRARRSA